MDEYWKAQPVSGYPIKLPLGLKKLRSNDNPEVIRAFADLLGSLMHPTDRSPVDHLKTHEFISSLTQHAYYEPWKPHEESKAGQQGGVQHGR